MIRDISSEIVVNLKDRLRDVRHVIRASRQDTSVIQDLPDKLLGKAARVMDKALTAAETISISLVSQDPAVHSTTIEARSLDAYFPSGKGNGEALFRRDVYYLAKRMFAVLGSRNALLHEATFSAVHSVMVRRHSALLAQARTTRDLTDIAKVCATLAVEMQSNYRSARTPVSTSQLQWPDQDTQYLCFSAISLAIGLATYADIEPNNEKLVESALLALQARQDRFVKATETSDRITDLAALFAFLIPHLP
jgi:hypothetical protein